MSIAANYLKTTATMLLGLSLITVCLAASQSDADFYSSGSTDGWSREFSVGEPYNVKRVSAPTRRGASALRMETRYGDAGNGYHTEMEKLDAGVPGETAWYGFSTYVPTSWVDSEQIVIVAQWWSHNSAGPPLSFEIRGDEWLLAQRWQERPSGKVKEPVSAVRKGEWTDWVIEAHWSDRDSGYLKVWRNGEVVYERRGPNIYRRTKSLRFKLGLYVWPWKDERPSPTRSSPRVIYHDEVRIGGEDASYDAVSPARP